MYNVSGFKQHLILLQTVLKTKGSLLSLRSNLFTKKQWFAPSNSILHEVSNKLFVNTSWWNHEIPLIIFILVIKKIKLTLFFFSFCSVNDNYNCFLVICWKFISFFLIVSQSFFFGSKFKWFSEKSAITMWWCLYAFHLITLEIVIISSSDRTVDG